MLNKLTKKKIRSKTLIINYLFLVLYTYCFIFLQFFGIISWMKSSIHITIVWKWLLQFIVPTFTRSTFPSHSLFAPQALNIVSLLVFKLFLLILIWDNFLELLKLIPDDPEIYCEKQSKTASSSTRMNFSTLFLFFFLYFNWNFCSR